MRQLDKGSTPVGIRDNGIHLRCRIDHARAVRSIGEEYWQASSRGESHVNLFKQFRGIARVAFTGPHPILLSKTVVNINDQERTRGTSRDRSTQILLRSAPYKPRKSSLRNGRIQVPIEVALPGRFERATCGLGMRGSPFYTLTIS